MIFEIHEVNEEVLIKISLNVKYNDILVFDDGLYSQYHFIDDILRIKCKKYFAISSNLIADVNDSQIWDINRNMAMWLYKEKRNKSSYMNINQIEDLLTRENCYLCLHGHNHLKFKDYIDKHKDLKFMNRMFLEDFEESIKWFNLNLKYVPDSYCFPYNYTFNGFLEAVVKENFPKIKTLFGKGRKPIS